MLRLINVWFVLDERVHVPCIDRLELERRLGGREKNNHPSLLCKVKISDILERDIVLQFWWTPSVGRSDRWRSTGFGRLATDQTNTLETPDPEDQRADEKQKTNTGRAAKRTVCVVGCGEFGDAHERVGFHRGTLISKLKSSDDDLAGLSWNSVLYRARALAGHL
jgi:hypothetical protein